MLVTLRCEAEQPRQAKREQIAALGRHQRMQLIENDALERTEQIGRVIGREQERELFRRCEQNIRRIAALALALRGRRVAGTRFDADRQPHIRDRCFQIARNVDRERLQRRDIERVQAAFAPYAAVDGNEFSFLPSPRLRSKWRGGGGGGNFRVWTSTQLHQARQKAGQRLAAAGRRDQQHRAATLRLCQKLQLVRARRPAAAGEPAREYFRKRRKHGGIEQGHLSGGGGWSAKRKVRQYVGTVDLAAGTG